MFPISTEFLKSKGDDFGQPNDVKSILANGPFLLKSITSKSSVVFEKNDNYWDKKNVHLKEVKIYLLRWIRPRFIGTWIL